MKLIFNETNKIDRGGTKMLKKTAIIVVIMMMWVTVLGQSVSANDISGHSEEREMRYLIEQDIMRGYGDGTFKPGVKVTRAEFAAFVARALDLPAGKNTFPDVPKGYKGNLDVEVGRVAATNIVQGYEDGTFQPDKQISRQEMANIIHKALIYEGVEVETLAQLSFSDENKIGTWAKEAVQFNVTLGIIRGHNDNTFKPQDDTIRAHAAKVIFEMLHVVDPIEITPYGDYHVVTVNSDGSTKTVNQYETYEKARSNVKSGQFIKLESKIIWMDNSDGGTATASGQPFTLIYSNERLNTHITYIQIGSQMEFLEVKGDVVKVRISGVEGYAKLNEVTLHPSKTNPSRSHYTVNSSGELLHRIVMNNQLGGVYSIGPAPSFMKTGTSYYSWNGYQINGQDVYQYFNYLPFYTKTNYTAAELNNYVKAARPTSPLKDLGKDFKQVEKEMGVNALHLLALAIHEGGWGESAIARDKKNLFGIGAIDSGAYENAVTYTTYEASIRDAADKFLNQYSNHNYWSYHGPQLGNKAVGANVRYASDPYWGQKAAGHMYRADKYLKVKPYHLILF